MSGSTLGDRRVVPRGLGLGWIISTTNLAVQSTLDRSVLGAAISATARRS